ncbi:MAG: protein kinase [bacterium]|nr:protein kinase [bacterium]
MSASEASAQPERIGPYRIESRLGTGGMGRVYKAYDQRLDRLVAIKLILAAVDADEATRNRFQREARAAAQLSHPSIVQIYHLLEVDQDDYIVMEYVEGQTLAELLHEGPVGLLMALSLAHDVAAGLAAAHAAGIVHRDLKTENVIVTPANRAKILDFGLAKPIWHGETDAPLTGKGNILGTCRAMSPEQANGLEVDHRSDLFSLGTLLFETATGQSPFTGPTPVATLIKVCYHQQPSVRELNPNIPEEFSVLISQLLQKDSNSRPQSAHDVTAVLERIAEDSFHDSGARAQLASVVSPLRRATPSPGGRVDSSSDVISTSGSRRPGSDTSSVPWMVQTAHPEQDPTKASGIAKRTLWRRGRWMVFLGLPALLLLVFVAGFLLSRLEHSPLSTPPTAVNQASRNSLAVLGFKNLSRREDTAWLSTALAEVFSAELAAGEQMRIIPGESVARMRIELAVPTTDTLAADTLVKIRNNLGTDYVMLGSYLLLDQASDSPIRLLVRLQDTRSGDTVVTHQETGPQDHLFELVSQVGIALREKLGVSETPIAEAQAARAALSPSPEATQLYSQGLEKLRRFDALSARDFFQRAVKIDPDYALAHAALSQAWLALHYDTEAEKSATRALELAKDLPRKGTLMIEGRRYEAAAEWDNAVDTYRVLWGYDPNDIEHGLRLAHAQTQAGEGEVALRTLESLHRLPPPACDDPRIDLAEAAAAESLSDYQRELEAARSAEAKGEEQLAWTLVAQAKRLQGWALMHLGQRVEAADPLQHALDLFERANDRGNIARTLSHIGALYDFEGNLSEARRLYEQALEVLRDIGYRERVSATLTNIAQLAQKQGDLTEAMTKIDEAIGISRQIGPDSVSPASLINKALVLLEQGELEEAEQTAQESLEIFNRTGWRRGAAWTYFTRGEISLTAGDLKAAREMYAAAQALCVEIKLPHLTAYVLDGLGQVLLAEGDLAGAQKALDESIAIRSDLGERGTVAETQSTYAVLWLELENPSKAAAVARQAAEKFHQEERRDEAARAYTRLARAFLAQGRLAEARNIHVSATQYANRSESPQLRLSVDITAARLLAADGDGDADAALRRLESILDEATERRLSGLELEARLALGQIELASGKTTAGRLRLESLAADADSKGFRLIASKAAAGARSP